MKKALVVYYSWSNGNTECIAQQLAKAIHADIARIETQKAYEGKYDDVVQQGKREVEEGYEPALKPLAVNLDAYDVIAVGTPTWWYTMAPAVRSFLHGHSWKGKTVIPFMTHGGWPGHVLRDMEKACEEGTVMDEMQVQFDSNGGDYLITPEKKIDAWIKEVEESMEMR